MAILLVTAATVEPITLGEAKAHLRVVGADEDAYIMALIASAREAIENMTGRAFISSKFKQVADGFPASNKIRFLLQPVSAVHSVKYYDGAGVLQTLSASNYIADIERAQVVIKDGFSWPSTRNDINAVEIEFQAGYGDSGADCPAALRHSVLVLIDHLYNYRGLVTSGTVADVPHHVTALAMPFKVW